MRPGKTKAARVAPAALENTQQRPTKDSTTTVKRGRRHYLLTCLGLGLLQPEYVAKVILREVDQEAQ